jgi:peptidyl-prolyl cis-trans isomerase C
MGRRYTAFVLVLLPLFAIACERSAPPAGTSGEPGVVAASYGAEVLTADELAAELERLPERSRRTMTAEARTKFVENYVLNELLFAAGEREGLAEDPEIARQVADLKKRLVVQKLIRRLQDVPAVTDDQVRAYYDANPEKFSTATIKARHILVRDEAKAKELHAQIAADPSKFAELAQANSTDAASARKGGDLGFFGRGRMVPEFEAAAFALRPGEVSEIVETPYGYHIIQVEEVREGTTKPFDTVKEQIRATLRSQELQERTRAYYDDLKARAAFTIDEAVVEEVAARSAASAPSAPTGARAMPPGHPPVGRMPAGDQHQHGRD